jgi:hypothetical protein
MARKRVSVPTFSDDSRLARYIPEEYRLAGGRAAVPAFEADHIKNPELAATSHLSVNSTEVESLDQIAEYHRLNWQDGRGKTALTVHKLFEYSDSGRKSAVAITLNPTSAVWEFADLNQKMSPAYRHRPVAVGTKNNLGSKSHCGVEFVRVFDEYRSSQFARRLASKGKFHLL